MNQKAFDLMFERSVIEQFKRIGYSTRQIEIVNEDHFSDDNDAQVYYYYSGPLDEKTRPFCAELLNIDKFYRESDLNSLSKKVGYDVVAEKGTFNCRHEWKKVKAKMKQEAPTRRQIDKAAVKQSSNVQNYFPFDIPFPKEEN